MERGPDAGVLLRLSTDDADAAAMWKSMLWKACSMEDGGWSEEGVRRFLFPFLFVVGIAAVPTSSPGCLADGLLLVLMATVVF